MSATGSVRGAGLAPPRDPAQRKADVLGELETARYAWLATGGESGAHLVPLGCVWDGARLVMATRQQHVTVHNLRRRAECRVALGDPTDVVLIDGTVEITAHRDLPPDAPGVLADLPVNPTRVPGCVYLFLTPRRILAWRHRGEIPGRTVMTRGRWVV
ncbi:pyridoxamine 5'-phosphate oxidase family protein [Nonomuraea sp. NPDC059023]|uniref:pyridoxamine 5'-phosphate oxidase family protein n=1 Tax=unclassified Nonomuraea TaxID=2593643 RepID=UPI00369C0160